jgi:hypothetical protein
MKTSACVGVVKAESLRGREARDLKQTDRRCQSDEQNADPYERV